MIKNASTIRAPYSVWSVRVGRWRMGSYRETVAADFCESDPEGGHRRWAGKNIRSVMAPGL